MTILPISKYSYFFVLFFYLCSIFFKIFPRCYIPIFDGLVLTTCSDSCPYKGNIDNRQWKTGFFQQLVNDSFHFHNLRTFVAIFVSSRFTHFFRQFLLAKIAITATFSAFRMYVCRSLTSRPFFKGYFCFGKILLFCFTFLFARYFYILCLNWQCLN